jgi:hypothetical protein
VNTEIGPAHPVDEVQGAFGEARVQVVGEENPIPVLEEDGLLIRFVVVVDPIRVAVAWVRLDEHQAPGLLRARKSRSRYETYRGPPP